MDPLKIVTTIQKKIKKVVDSVLEKTSLHVVFIIGIGLTSLIAKIFLKDFVIKKFYITSWKKKIHTQLDNKMY